MRAAQISEYGGPDVLQFTASAPKPEAGTGEVLVQVYAASANPFDNKLRQGVFKDRVGTTLPAILGGDCAGVVVDIGTGVSGFEIGQAVYGQANAAKGTGSFAEFTAVDAAGLAARPASVDYLVAAALPLVCCSAYQALVDHMKVQAGQKILIHGGGGGIGSAAIQLAKHFGLYVATTVSSDNADYARVLGADEVIDYHSQDFATAVSDYDAVFDTVGGETNKKSYSVLKPGGILVSMTEEADNALLDEYHIEYVLEFTKVTTERLDTIAKLVDDGILSINVDKVFELEDTSEALSYLADGHPRGKVVIKVAAPQTM